MEARVLRGSRLPEQTLQGGQAILGELTIGVGWDLDDQHVAGGPVHNLRWDGAELVALRGAYPAVPNHDKTSRV